MILFYEKVPDKQSRGDDYGQDRHGRPVFFDSRRFLRSFKFQYRRCLAYRAIRNSLYLELVGLFFNADQGIGTIKLIGLSWREYRFAEQDDAVIMIAYFHYRIHIPLSCQYMTACIRIYYVIVIATGLYGIITDFTDFQRIHFSLDALKGGLVNFSPFHGQAYRQ